ncbi:hypothetical protein [Stakelama marina]|uniref:Uncharacterized protein n=1 Tax=Stakelama marina TaxID=2826939 RepID=A0A8T4IBE6_9SPHN|nr:hypothetical protein [Stakelama marina]MBR0551743.1 hypothetical protein [Stakelama marina]
MNRPTLCLRFGRELRHTITIQREAFGSEIDVRVSPSPEGVGHDRGFRCVCAARAYARGFGSATGWPVVDLTLDGDKAA